MRTIVLAMGILMLLTILPAEAQRLGSPPPPPAAPGGPNANETAPAPPPPPPAIRTSSELPEGVQLFFTDERLYGFAQPSDEQRRLGNKFDFYVVVLNGSVEYRVIIDDEPIRLGNGEKKATATGIVVEHLEFESLRRAHLKVELTRGNETEIVDYGMVRVRTIAAVDDDAEEDPIEDAIKGSVRVFSSGEFTWLQIRVGLVSLTAIGLAIFAGINRAYEAQEQERMYTVGY